MQSISRLDEPEALKAQQLEAEQEIIADDVRATYESRLREHMHAMREHAEHSAVLLAQQEAALAAAAHVMHAIEVEAAAAKSDEARFAADAVANGDAGAAAMQPPQGSVHGKDALYASNTVRRVSSVFAVIRRVLSAFVVCFQRALCAFSLRRVCMCVDV